MRVIYYNTLKHTHTHSHTSPHHTHIKAYSKCVHIFFKLFFFLYLHIKKLTCPQQEFYPPPPPPILNIWAKKIYTLFKNKFCTTREAGKMPVMQLCKFPNPNSAHHFAPTQNSASKLSSLSDNNTFHAKLVRWPEKEFYFNLIMAFERISDHF